MPLGEAFGEFDAFDKSTINVFNMLIDVFDYH